MPLALRHKVAFLHRPIFMAASPLIPSKRPREDDSLPSTPAAATSQRFKNAVVLAPMVRSGTMPTRLLALKYGASLVWGPEIVDKAMLHAKRVVNSETGVVSFEGITSSIFSCHPIERPYLIYQIGSSNPQLAAQAAKMVAGDISGVDLNCGCPKSFSTSGGMGAALLDTPELLCSILSSLREALPPHLSVSCKIRLLPTQEATIDLVKQIIRTGINALTVHCRTRVMRPGQRAVIERLKEIVDVVKASGVDVAVIENGDCVSAEDAKRIREITGADSVMIATSAESNPSCFSGDGLMDAEMEVVPNYLKIARYLGNGWGNTKHCISSFKSAPGENEKTRRKELRAKIAAAKDYDALDSVVSSLWDGLEVFEEIKTSIQNRERPVWWDNVESWEAANPLCVPTSEEIKEILAKEERPRKKQKMDTLLAGTPLDRPNPESGVKGTPFFVSHVPALIAGRNERSPSPERTTRI